MPSIVNDLHRRRPDAVVSAKTTKPTIAQVGKTWGRDRDVSTLTVLLSLCILVFCPLMVIYFWVACNGFSCSLTGPVEKLLQLYTKTGSAGRALMLFTDEEFPKPSSQGYQLYAGWLLFQGLCYAFLPATIGYGQRTPAGHLLPYKVNGLLAWVVTHVLFLTGCLYFDLFPGSIIQNNWGGLLVAANVYGYFLTFFSYAKALLFPSHPEDRKFSGSIIYDIFMGVEFNPRFGKLWDFKLFHNGRPGIIAWTLINLSFAFAQYEKIGYVTNSMILLNFLHAVYVLDFFYNEDWYLRTIDITHDHFGFYLSWGDSVWLPFMYTVQSNYLLQNPIDLSAPYFLFVLCTGLSGYFIFRSVNHQKDIVRRTDGKCMVWGKPAKVIRAPFLTSDGVPRESLLLASGYWGISRHFNYVGDLLISLAMCLTCGFGHLLPYFYIIYMSILLLHRIQRDDARCRGKYGPYWEEYCKAVPYKLLPPVY